MSATHVYLRCSAILSLLPMEQPNVVQCRLPNFDLLPGMTRSMLTRPDGSLLNTCTSDAIIQILRFLKRAYWPFAWDSSQGLAGDSRGLGIGGGFASAAQVSSPPPFPLLPAVLCESILSITRRVGMCGPTSNLCVAT